MKAGLSMSTVRKIRVCQFRRNDWRFGVGGDGPKSTLPPPRGGGEIPSPGKKVARVSGSEEECGRKPESQHNKTDLCQSYH